MEFLKEPETWVALGFAIIVALVLYRRIPAFIGAALDARAAAISKELDEAKRLRNEAAKLHLEYTSRLAKVEDEAGKILTEARAEAERFAAESRTALTAQIERRAQQAKDKIAQAESAAMAEIRNAAADAAVAAAEKLIAARLDEKRSGALIEQSIKELPAKLN